MISLDCLLGANSWV